HSRASSSTTHVAGVSRRSRGWASARRPEVVPSGFFTVNGEGLGVGRSASAPMYRTSVSCGQLGGREGGQTPFPPVQPPTYDGNPTDLTHRGETVGRFHRDCGAAARAAIVRAPP